MPGFYRITCAQPNPTHRSEKHALVPSVVARTLAVPEVAGRSILEAVQERLRDKQLLLVVDNFEQVVEAAPLLEELLFEPGTS